MENPLTLNTRNAMGVFGALARRWSTSPEALKEVADTEDGRIWVMPADRLHEILQEAGLSHGAAGDVSADYALRDDIEEVEIVLRVPGKASFLLPEAQIMNELADIEPGMRVRVPAIYSWNGQHAPLEIIAPTVPAVNDPSRGFTDVLMLANPLEAFLDPYMAGYLCSQCK